MFFPASALAPFVLLLSLASAQSFSRQSSSTSTTTTYGGFQSTSSVDLSSLLASLQSSMASSTLSSTTSASATHDAAQSTTATSSIAANTPPPSTSLPNSAFAASSTSSPSSGGSTGSNRTLVIVLAVVFSLLALALLLASLILLRRYRRGQAPFTRFAGRGASPIDDDEIATWRGHTQQMSQTSVSTHHRQTSSADMFAAPADLMWSVNSSPSSGRSEQVSSPPIIAHAPNARSGLTDESKPGESPYIPPLKRQSSRISKLPNHYRSKSRRSSLAMSLKDKGRPITIGTWVDLEDDGFKRHLRDDSRGSKAGSITKISFDRFRSEQDIPDTPKMPAQAVINPADIGRALS